MHSEEKKSQPSVNHVFFEEKRVVESDIIHQTENFRNTNWNSEYNTATPISVELIGTVTPTTVVDLDARDIETPNFSGGPSLEKLHTISKSKLISEKIWRHFDPRSIPTTS